MPSIIRNLDPIDCYPHLHKKPVEGRGSLDPGTLAAMTISDRAVLDQLDAGSNDKEAEMDDDGILRKDTALTAEERNARLETIEDEPTQMASSVPGLRGRPFKVEWLKV